MDIMKGKHEFIGDEWAVIGIAGSLWPLWVGWQYSAKSTPQLSKNGFTTNQIMTRKASASFNHVCMDAMQDKQKSIGDKWAAIAASHPLWPLWVGWQ